MPGVGDGHSSAGARCFSHEEVFWRTSWRCRRPSGLTSELINYSEITGAGADADVLTARRQVTFEEFLQEHRASKEKFWEGETEHVMCLGDAWAFLDQILDAQDTATFLGLKRKWNLAEKALGQIVKGVKQSADDLTRHMKVKVSENNRAQKRKAEEQDKQALQKVKDDAKAAADAIKKRKQSAEAVPALFTASVPDNVAQRVSHLDSLAQVAETQWRHDFPWKCPMCDSLKMVLGEGKVQKALATWGSQYKRTLAQTKLDQVTFPFEEKSGLRDVNGVFADIVKATELPDISGVPGGKAFTSAAWLFGCHVDMKAVGFTPNHAALVKLLAVGEVRRILVEWSSFKDAIGEFSSIEEVLTKFKKMDQDGLKDLAAKGVVMRQCLLQKQEVLYIPMGWLSVEVACPSPFIYGIRKSFFIKSKGKVYEESIEVAKSMEGTGKSVERMGKILETMDK